MNKRNKKKLSKKLKQTKGITLVALAVTIIILLILAGVSISLVFNSDGLFSKANEAASRYNQSKEDELTFLQGAEEYFDRYNGIYGGGTTGTPAETGTPTPTETITPTPEPTLPAVGEEPPAEGWTVEQAKALMARDGLQAHIGEKVAYSPIQDTTGVYRIFYYDNEVNSGDATKGYFGDPLNTLYLKRDYVSQDTTLNGHLSHTSSDRGAIMRKMNPKWAKASNGSSIDLQNEHCVAWLCDPEQWTKYKVDGIANYVIGSPSVEMYMKAFNVYKDNNANSTTLINKIGNTDGYSVGAHNNYTWNDSTEHYTGDNSIEAGPNNIFMTAGNNFWWLASPASHSAANVLFVCGAKAYVYGTAVIDTYGVCPVVSISQ